MSPNNTAASAIKLPMGGKEIYRVNWIQVVDLACASTTFNYRRQHVYWTSLLKKWQALHILHECRGRWSNTEAEARRPHPPSPLRFCQRALFGGFPNRWRSSLEHTDGTTLLQIPPTAHHPDLLHLSPHKVSSESKTMPGCPLRLDLYTSSLHEILRDSCHGNGVFLRGESNKIHGGGGYQTHSLGLFVVIYDSSNTINLHLKLTCLIEMQPAVKHGE